MTLFRRRKGTTELESGTLDHLAILTIGSCPLPFQIFVRTVYLQHHSMREKGVQMSSYPKRDQI